MRSKDEVRADVWHSMDREGVSRFPGAESRIPNYAGAKAAAERLAKHPAWVRAETL
jgi:5-formyltetrahydrofolate cyclo-ligase